VAEPVAGPVNAAGSSVAEPSNALDMIQCNISCELDEIMKECNDLVDPNYVPNFDDIAAFLRAEDDMEVAPNHEVDELPIWQN